jgi:hypothetical protein
MATPKTTSDRFAKMALDKAKARMGVGWDLLSTEMQEALVCRELLCIIRHQEGEKWTAAVEVADTLFSLTETLSKKP